MVYELGGFGGGCSENLVRMPEHKVTRILNTRTLESEMQLTKKDIKNLPKTAFASKVVNLFTRALAPPFIGRRRDFLHPKNTLKFWEYS
jgi:hypothetical protein